MRFAADALRRAGQGTLSAELARDLLAEGGQLVDLRAPYSFHSNAMPGAVNLPVEALGHDYRLLDKREPVIVCGAGVIDCVRAARMLAGQGFAQVYRMEAS